MAVDDYSFYKNSSNTNDKLYGVRKAYSSLSDPSYKDPSYGDNSNLYFRDYTVNSNLVKVLLDGSEFQNLDGSKGISFRIDLRTPSAITNRQVLFLVKTDNATPDASLSNWQNTEGYKIGFHCPYGGATNGIFNSNSTKTTFQSSGINTSFWSRIRVDVVPVLDQNGTIIGDKIDYYSYIYNSNTWSLTTNGTSTLTINSSDARFIPWGDATYNRYGFQISGWYIDNFQVYISN